MTELDRIKAVAPSNASAKSPPHRSTTLARPESFVATLEPEGDLERVVSQAALYISELCKILKISAHIFSPEKQPSISYLKFRRFASNITCRR